MKLARHYNQMSYKSEKDIYAKWGGEASFLSIVEVYLIVENGMLRDASDEELAEAVEELASSRYRR